LSSISGFIDRVMLSSEAFFRACSFSLSRLEVPSHACHHGEVFGLIRSEIIPSLEHGSKKVSAGLVLFT
jgi:hypothetical protein